MWRRYSQPGMYEDFMPVWPSLDDTRLWIVPRAPRDSGLVCVVCRNAHYVRSVLLPKTLTITQLCQSIQYLTGWEVGQVRSPPAAYARLCLADDSNTVLRDGDVLDVLACRADCHPYDIHRTAVLKDHVLWTRACRLHSRVAVFVWQPGPAQPILTCCVMAMLLSCLPTRDTRSTGTENRYRSPPFANSLTPISGI